MRMSVFRQADERSEMDHLDCLNATTDEESGHMVMHAMLHNATVLVGMEGGEAIIKPWEETDTRLSFAGLYDTCISLRDWRRMKKTGAKAPKDLPPFIYEIAVGLEVSPTPCVTVTLTAEGDLEARAKLVKLVNSNAEFRSQLIVAWATAAIVRTDLLGGNVHVVTNGPLRLDDASADTPEWKIEPQR